MAVSGGATVAYWCQVIGDQLFVAQATALRTSCVEVDDALEMLSKGDRALVAGSDVAAVRRGVDARIRSIDGAWTATDSGEG